MHLEKELFDCMDLTTLPPPPPPHRPTVLGQVQQTTVLFVFGASTRHLSGVNSSISRPFL